MLLAPGGPLEPLRLLVDSQTPLLRLRAEPSDGRTLHIRDLRVGKDYKLTAGGVTRMLLPFLRRGLDAGGLARAEWVALGAFHPHPDVELDPGLLLSFVGLSRHEAAAYASLKERTWGLLNGLPEADGAFAPTALEDRAFRLYATRHASKLHAAAERIGGAHAIYVHDFQQMSVARELGGPRPPIVFHLHTPFPSTLPGLWRDRIVSHLNDYDAVVCSSQRYAANLRASGVKRPIRVLIPFVDPQDYPTPSVRDVARFRAEHGLSPRHRTVLCVARMDPMKGQDRLIRAMPRLLREVPDARLVLVGNGSFSSSKKGGLALDKGARWRAHLEALARELDVDERVVFTGHVAEDRLSAAYAACDVFALPSVREGFGLAAIEAWLHGKPILISERAGVAELVDDRANGRVLDCSDPERVARALADLLSDPERARLMGEAGRASAAPATLSHGSSAVFEILHEAIGREIAAR